MSLPPAIPWQVALPQSLPPLPPNVRVEAIFLVLEQSAETSTERRPPVSLAGFQITGDIIGPAVGGWERG